MEDTLYQYGVELTNKQSYTINSYIPTLLEFFKFCTDKEFVQLMTNDIEWVDHGKMLEFNTIIIRTSQISNIQGKCGGVENV